MRRFTVAAATALTLIGAAQANELRPIEARNIGLGDLSGVVYHTVERDGFRVVITLAEGEAGTPVRFEAVLAPGQSVALSSPREVGVAALAVEISRQGDSIRVLDASAAN